MTTEASGSHDARERSRSQECGQLPEAGKGKEMDFPVEPPEEISSMLLAL